MAHTDRDRQRWMRHNHNDVPCPYDDREILPVVNGRFPVHAIHCDVCSTLWSGVNRPRFYTSTDAYSAWAKEERRVERGKAKQALRDCRDWDELSIRYRRPYFD